MHKTHISGYTKDLPQSRRTHYLLIIAIRQDPSKVVTGSQNEHTNSIPGNGTDTYER